MVERCRIRGENIEALDLEVGIVVTVTEAVCRETQDFGSGFSLADFVCRIYIHTVLILSLHHFVTLEFYHSFCTFSCHDLASSIYRSRLHTFKAAYVNIKPLGITAKSLQIAQQPISTQSHDRKDCKSDKHSFILLSDPHLPFQFITR